MTSDNLHFVANEMEFENTTRIIADIKGREIAVFSLDQEYYALANYCVHQGGPLCEGAISGALTTDNDFELEYSREGEIISCPWHGWEFDIQSGEHLSHTGYKVPTYKVVCKDGSVFVELKSPNTQN